MTALHAIQPFAPHIEFLIGRVSDAEVAQCAGCSIEQVIERRQHLGLQAVKAPSLTVKRPNAQGASSAEAEIMELWGVRLPVEVVGQLGSMPDADLSSQTGISHSQIRRAREAMGIRRSTRGVEVPLPPEVEAKLGTMTDVALATLSGFPISRIYSRRTFRGIAAYAKSPEGKAMAAVSGRWDKKSISMLGTVVDDVIAKRLGISKAAVASKRKTLGIPSFKSQKA